MSMTFAELEKGLAPVSRDTKLRTGDTVRVHVKIQEGNKTRVQIFEGTIIRIRNGGIRTTFTVRKTSFGVGVERIFTLCSPWIETIEIKAHNIVRRSKLYYLRDRAGRSARLREERSRK